MPRKEDAFPYALRYRSLIKRHRAVNFDLLEITSKRVARLVGLSEAINSICVNLVSKLASLRDPSKRNKQVVLRAINKVQIYALLLACLQL